MRQQSESFAFCQNNIDSGYTEVIKTLTISEQSVGALSEQNPISGIKFSDEVHYIDDNDADNLKIISSGDMSKSWESFPILIKSHQTESIQDFESILYPQFYQGYIAVKWEATDTTGCMIALEYSVDDITWWTWAELEITGHGIGKFIFGTPKLNKSHLDKDFYFKLKFKSSDSSGGIIDAIYVPMESVESARNNFLQKPIPTPIPTPLPTKINQIKLNKLNQTFKKTLKPVEEFLFSEKEENWAVPFPDFNYDPSQDFKFDPEINQYVDEEGNFVHILESGCSIPCETANVSASFDGCCILRPTASAGGGGLSFGFVPAKDGTVTVGAPDEAGCAKITVKINGQETKSLFVEACEAVSIEVTVEPKEPTEPECCNVCAFVTAQPTTLIPECQSGTPMIKKVNKSTGESKTFINRKRLINELKKRTQRRQ
jgi:hypothetical protein